MNHILGKTYYGHNLFCTYKDSVFVKASKKWLLIAKALAYCTTELITAIKGCIKQAPGIIDWAGKACQGQTIKSTQKGKAQCNWSPCTNQFRLAAFDIAGIIYLFAQQVPYEEVNSTEPSP